MPLLERGHFVFVEGQRLVKTGGWRGAAKGSLNAFPETIREADLHYMHQAVQRMKNEVAYCNLILNSETGTLSGIPPYDVLRQVRTVA